MTFEKIKSFAKKHKTALITGGVGIAAFTIGYMVCKDRMKIKLHNEEGERILNTLQDALDDPFPAGANSRAIDEDIFTSLAPEIEEAILDDNVIEKVIERTYDGPSSKHVKIIVSDARASRFELERMWGKNWNKVLEVIG